MDAWPEEAEVAMSTPEAEIPNPLSEDDLRTINERLAQSRGVEGLIQKARLAGIDVTRLEQQNREAQERLRRIKQAFFPGR